ncbi:MAG: CPBP family intramembrane metalloprotease, partial [Clostridium sp.]|nr:CPBP family intramembrane metalloprotease [Clostridium sp.]
LFILILHFVYKKTSNRKKSIILSSIIVMLVFGLLHINTFGNIIQILFIQGLGSIFQLYGYLKTKNILIPIFVHLLINCSSWIPLLLGIH